MNGQVTLITIDGKARSAKAWSRRAGAITHKAILLRLQRGLEGWHAVFAPRWDKDAIRPVKRRPAAARRSIEIEKPWLVRSQFGSVRSFPLSMLDLLRKHS